MDLYYFDRGEFVRGGRDWYNDMHPRLLVLLDVFRHMWGRPIAISPHPAALGRIMDPERKSDHNFSMYGQVLAADIMPAEMTTPANVYSAIYKAGECGFTSIGLYPHWQPGPGLHLGVRDGHPKTPAKWGAILVDGKQTYVSLDDAMKEFA